MKRWPTAWLCLSVVLVVSVVMLNISCRRVQKTGTPKAVVVTEDGLLRLRLMTLNVRYENSGDMGSRAWRARIPDVVRVIQVEAPDIIGVQEAMHGQVADLWASLPDYGFLGAARDDGKRRGEYTGLFYLRDRFEVCGVEGGVFWLSDTPEKPGSAHWGNTVPRMVIWQRFTDRASRRSFSAYNTHWDHMHQGSRVKSGEAMRSHIAARWRPENPVVVLGDFNARESNPAVAHLRGLGNGGQPYLLDTFEVLHAGEKRRTTLHFWRGRRDGNLKVDHILASSPVRVTSARIRDNDPRMVSDHFPVVAEVEFPTP
jgi:endonuclease/exonuclease/phosphatase family metal-dependent hydrolase